MLYFELPVIVTGFENIIAFGRRSQELGNCNSPKFTISESGFLLSSGTHVHSFLSTPSTFEDSLMNQLIGKSLLSGRGVKSIFAFGWLADSLNSFCGASETEEPVISPLIKKSCKSGLTLAYIAKVIMSATKTAPIKTKSGLNAWLAGSSSPSCFSFHPAVFSNALMRLLLWPAFRAEAIQAFKPRALRDFIFVFRAAINCYQTVDI